VVSGADSWTEVENFGELKLGWLRRFVGLPNGIPSYDTLGRFFAMLDSEQFEECFRKWVAGITKAVGGEDISIDGKMLYGSHDKHSNKGAIHLVRGRVRTGSSWGRSRPRRNPMRSLPSPPC
jgi:hypothetical protein